MSEIKDWIKKLEQDGIDKAKADLADFERRQALKELRKAENEYRKTPMGKLDSRIDSLEYELKEIKMLVDRIYDKFNWNN